RADRARDAKDWLSAARLYGEALAASPEPPGIWVQYGHALKESGRRDEAEQAYRRALALSPDEADTYLQLGHVLKLAGRTDEAGECYLRALQLDPHQDHAARELIGLAAAGVAIPRDGVIGALSLGALPSPDSGAAPALARA